MEPVPPIANNNPQGYGSIVPIPMLIAMAIAKSPKLFVRHSILQKAQTQIGQKGRNKIQLFQLCTGSFFGKLFLLYD